MKKPVVITALICLSFLAFMVFQVEYRVQGLENELEEINRQLTLDLEEIHVLKAEWAYLNRPERLKHIADSHLPLDRVNTAQFTRIEDIPFAPTVVAGEEDDYTVALVK